ncbi:hypothetical protein VKT23_005989 [Stygiomarasmius scandens]|uniref:Cytochrome P450 n=1 Tax=Marasmiellus scandens TaxID=2682957 RepID=A0ABR1JPL1_9AGAR
MYTPLFLLLTVISIWVVGLFVYRLFLHPLRNFPGPRLAALTDYYAGYHDIVKDGRFLKRIEQLHSQFGPVVRVGPNTLHFVEPQAYADIYTHGTSFTKPSLLYNMFFNLKESSFGFKDPREARQRKQVLSPFFSRRAILKLKGFIQEKIDKLVSRIKDYPEGEPINLTYGFRSLTMEIITSYCFATGYNTLEHPTFEHPLILAFHDISHLYWYMRYFAPFMRLSMAIPIWIIELINPVAVEPTRMAQDLERLISSYLKDENQLRDVEHETIFHRLILPETKEGKVDRSLRPSKRSLLHEAIILLGAGSDTVANASCVGTCYALQDPAISGKLKEELRLAWPDEDSTPDLSVLEQLPYLVSTHGYY